MKRRAKGKKKIAFSKIIFAGVSIMTIAVVIFSCRMMYITGDLSPLCNGREGEQRGILGIGG